MKLLHAINYIGPRSYGLGSVAGGLAACQNRSGVDASIASFDPPDEIQKVSKMYGLPVERFKGYECSWPPSIGFSYGFHSAMIRGLDGNVDIIHQHGIWTGLSFSVDAWRKARDGRTLIAPHGALSKWSLSRSSIKKKIALLGYEYSNLRNATCMHATSRLERQDFRDFGLKGPIASLPNGIDDEWLTSTGSSSRFRTSFGIHHDRHILLYMGRISPVKNVATLVDAFAESNAAKHGWQLVLAGASEFGYEAEVRSTIKRREVENYVTFVGLLTGQIKRDAFAAAQCFVLPSLAEGFGMVVLEAIATGLPAITTTGAAWDLLPAEGCGWRVDPSCGGLASAIKSAVDLNPSQLIEMGIVAKRIARRDFLISTVCDRLGELYHWMRHGGVVPSFVEIY